MTSKVDTTTLAFTWAALSAAETLLHCVSRNSKNARSHAELLSDFVAEGKLGLPPSHYVEQIANQYRDLLPHQTSAKRLLTKVAPNRARGVV